jgi:hypothetical protein
MMLGTALVADIRLDGVRVPESSRLPGGDTFKDAGRVLVTTRGTGRLGRSRACGGCLRHRAHLCEAASPVRATAGELPDRPGSPRQDARRGHEHAALLVLHTFEGTETMQALIVGRDITGVGAFA